MPKKQRPSLDEINEVLSKFCFKKKCYSCPFNSFKDCPLRELMEAIKEYKSKTNKRLKKYE